jgi:uncharacterized protein (TIGR00730 family)
MWITMVKDCSKEKGIEMQNISVCVYCGSRFGTSPDFKAQATDLGQRIAGEKWRLVYGAGDVGLMGAVARAAQGAGATTFGVIPTHLLRAEVGKTDLTHFVITENMHERKKVMFMNSDAIVVMPGGAGSMDEFFEVLTWAQLDLHNKPIILMNVAGYWDPLIGLINHMIANGFADPSLADLFTITQSAQETIAAIKGKTLK